VNAPVPQASPEPAADPAGEHSQVPAEVPDADAQVHEEVRDRAEAHAWEQPFEGGRRKSRLRRTLSKWANSSDQHARELQQTVRESGLVAVADAPNRTRVRLSGTLRTVTLRPRGGVPALEAELFDGSGALILVWLGRRQIDGIGPGRQIEVEGRIGVQDGVRVMYNPRYELRG
jgi:ferric-dicitrate binding protein FerR (iron transport regulator)